MDRYERQEKKREAMRRLRAQRRRAGELRGRVVAISLIGFVLLWGIVFAQMATGNDPVLGDSSQTVVPTSGHRAKAQRARAEASASAEPVEAEAEPEVEVLEPEVEVEPFVEEPEPVTTSQS